MRDWDQLVPRLHSICPTSSMGKKGKKKHTHKPLTEEEVGGTPHSFVLHRGHVGSALLQLEMDLRHVMEPYTALNLKVKKNNVLKDFLHVAGPLGVTHLLILSKTDVGTYLRFARLPRGPTLTFKVQEYALAKDIVSLLAKPKTKGNQYKKAPLLVLNNFTSDELPMKLMTTMFQNLFPAINIQKVQLADIRRCVLLNYDSDLDNLEFRHYNIEAVPVGMSRGVKKLIQTKIPNMSKLSDVSDFVLRAGCGYGSESEGEEPMDNQVELPQEMPGRGNVRSQQSAVRLTELGPRLSLQLIKVEDGLCTGDILYHKYITKTQKEMEATRKKKEQQRKLKESRRKQQEKNVARKEKAKELHKMQSIEGQKKKPSSASRVEDHRGSSSEDDDAWWYKQEVGETPGHELALHRRRSNQKSRKYSKTEAIPSRKRRLEDPNEHGPTKKSRNEKGLHVNRTGRKMTKQNTAKLKQVKKAGRSKKRPQRTRKH